jgi:sugar O-acyltransferase (sialic acid O-acetyltransferase NeuD family)
MSRIIVFGVADFASLAHFYLRHDSPHEVVAFAVTEPYLPESRSFEGLPVVDFAEVEQAYPPGDHRFFAPMSPKKMNRLRAGVFDSIRAKGYDMISYISSRATTFPGLETGQNCFILEDNTIQPFVRIGDNVVLWSGNHIGHHGSIGDHTFFTSHVVMSGHCDIGTHCFAGVNATIRDGARLAQGTLLGMGACFTGKETEEWSVYLGNPAERKGNVPSHKVM